ncbi:MAG: BatA and WFA domain-containing protein, partial [Pirellulaceae bacterium]|nr:BatA and WFA domain-containing protein [Pirellulaceae bacterium]
MNLLEFANPMGMWWAALAVPIVLLYVLKVRLRRQQVSTFLFWDKVFHEQKPRAWWQQLRHILSLLLQLLRLLLMVFALLDPLWHWQKTQGRKVLVVLDNSASMAAMDKGQTRLDAAKRAAVAVVRSLRVGDEMAILSAGGKPEVAIGLTDHARSLLETIAKLSQTDAPSALSETVTAARRLLVNDSRSTIYVLTDGCDEATAALSRDAAITLLGFGSKQDNVAITQFQVRRSLLDAIGYQILVEVSNLSDQAYQGRLEVTLEDQLVDVMPIELAAGANKTWHLDQASASGGRLVATLNTPDALSTDNTARAVLPVRRPIEVSLVSPGSLFLKSVLESIPLVDLKHFKLDTPPTETTQSDSTADSTAATTPSVKSPAELAPQTGAQSGAQPELNRQLPPEAMRSITILHKIVPNPLPPGKLLVINPDSACDLWTMGELMEQPLVASVDEQSPITQHVKLTNVLFPAARQLTFTNEPSVLIKTPLEEPLLVHLRRSTGDVLILNVDLDQGDLPLRIAFPVMMKNALEWFEGSQGELQPALATGSSTQIVLPEQTSPSVTSDASQASVGQPLPAERSNEPAGSGLSSDPGAAGASLASAPSLEQMSGPPAKTTDGGAAIQPAYWLRDPLGALTPLTQGSDTVTLPVLNRSGIWSVGTEANLAIDPWFNSAKPVEQVVGEQVTGASAEAAEAGLPAS